MAGPRDRRGGSAPVLTAAVAARGLVAVAAVALLWSYLLTWQLWQPRADPPNLPLASALRSIQFGVPLCVAAALAVVFPRAGATLHSALFVAALLGDQIRIQPQFVSLAILLLAGAWAPTGLHIGRWHLITLWAWAGIHKLLSADWAVGGAFFIANASGHGELRPVVAVLVPLAEVGLAVAALWPRAWSVLRIAGPLFHVGIVATLMMADLNTAIWPWNLALAAATPLVFRSPAPDERPAGQRSPVALTAAAAFALYPLGFYVGVSDTYLSHNLYANNTAQASICARGWAEAGGVCFPAFLSTLETLNVPLPPERRLFVGWFRRTCHPGEQLRIDGISTRLSPRRTDYVPCREGENAHSPWPAGTL